METKHKIDLRDISELTGINLSILLEKINITLPDPASLDQPEEKQ